MFSVCSPLAVATESRFRNDSPGKKSLCKYIVSCGSAYWSLLVRPIAQLLFGALKNTFKCHKVVSRHWFSMLLSALLFLCSGVDM
jgi:hypothetical protein